jgi:hypothetical protein
MTEKKSYFAVIPANVRYDENLSPNAKLLYGEITALCNAEGYCWASNKYFAELYSVSPITISRWINSLVSRGYITSQIIYKEGTNQIDKRYIQICYDPINENVNTPINKNVKENNTSLNNTFNNTNEYIDMSDKPPARPRFKPPTIEEVKSYCRERGNTVDAERFVDHYTSNGWMVGRTKMRDWKSAVRTWEKNGYDRKKSSEPKTETDNIFLKMLNEGAFDE